MKFLQSRVLGILCSRPLIFFILGLYLSQTRGLSLSIITDWIVPPVQASTDLMMQELTPEVPRFSRDRDQARCHANPSWNTLNFAERASRLESLLRRLLSKHKATGCLSGSCFELQPTALVCLAFHESTFDTQIKNQAGSSAVGLTQIVRSTLQDLLGQRNNFRSAIARYSHVSDPNSMIALMAQDPVLQLEMGLGVFEMKRQDLGIDQVSMRDLLQAYNGGRQQKAYAQAILNCTKCVQANNGQYSQDCLCRAKPLDPSCPGVQPQHPQACQFEDV